MVPRGVVGSDSARRAAAWGALVVALTAASGCLDFPPELLVTDGASDGAASHHDATADGHAARDSAVSHDGKAGPNCTVWGGGGWSCSSGTGRCGKRTLVCQLNVVPTTYGCDCKVSGTLVKNCADVQTTKAGTACEAARVSLLAGCCKP